MEDQALISKKELLRLTGISYGQLYRWKRKGLIPDEWFIRKSTFTGHEAFFPKEEILSRIEKIKNMKEDSRLDDLAGVFSVSPTNVAMTRKGILDRNIVVLDGTFDLYDDTIGPTDEFSFDQILFLSILERILQSGEVTLDEARGILRLMTDGYTAFAKEACDLVFVRKLGVSVCFLSSSLARRAFETGARVVFTLPLSPFVEELKIKIRETKEA
jgi:hypothetical protein